MGRKRKADSENMEYGQVSSTNTSREVIGPSKRRKSKTSQKEPEEKRLARWKPSCPKVIQERIERVRKQRFYMLDRQRDGLKEAFTVLGSTGNVYTVTIDKLPGCNCPDASKGNHCKHLIFVFLKCLAVKEESGLHYQKALLSSELEKIFVEAPSAPTDIANFRVRAAYAQVTGQSSSSQQGASQTKKKNVDGDDCPVCYEEMSGKTERELEGIVFCETCQNGLHKDCFQMWSLRTKPTTCVYCRSQWVTTDGDESVHAEEEDGYLNLGAIAGMGRLRDTTTYYHPRTSWARKRRYN